MFKCWRMLRDVNNGYRGLFVIVSAFMIQFISFGISMSVGVYNVEFLDYWNHRSTVAVSLIGAINIGFFLGAGPITSYLMWRLEHRTIVMIGAAMSTFGMLLLPFLPTLEYYYVFYGVLAGLGFCFVYVPSHVMSGLYFNKHRSLATGVATAGSGLGNTVMPMFIAYLIEQYSWKGSLLIMAGLCLNMFVFAALLSPLPSKIMTPTKEIEAAIETTLEISSQKHDSLEVVELKNFHRAQSEELEPMLAMTELQMDQSCREVCSKLSPGEYGREEVVLKQNCLERDDMRPFEESKTIPDTEHPVQKSCIKKVKVTLLDKNESVKETSVHNLENDNIRSFELPESLTVQEQDELGTIDNKTQEHLADSKHLNHSEPETKDSSLVQSNLHLSKGIIKQRIISNIPKDTPLKLLQIFCDFKFDVFFVNNFLWNITALMAFSFAPEFFLTRDISNIDAAFMVTVAGFGTFLGCILGGVVGNCICVNRLVFYTMGCLLMGMPPVILPFLTPSLIVYTAFMLLFGVFFGIVLGLLVIITSDLLGPERIGDGFGFVMLANGIGSFTGPVLAGFLWQTMGDYDSVMITAGLLCVMSAILMTLIPLSHSCRSKGRLGV